MIVENNGYSLKLDDKNGAIESLVCDGKEFIGEILPLFCFRLRKNGKITQLNSDMAGNVSFSESENSINIAYSDFENADDIIADIKQALEAI